MATSYSFSNKSIEKGKYQKQSIINVLIVTSFWVKLFAIREMEKHESHTPIAITKAKKFLMIVALSVPCERLFSNMGTIIIRNRN